jgi:uncharacterized protein
LLAGYDWFSSSGSRIYARLNPDLPRADYLAWIDRFDQYPPLPTVSNREAILRGLPVVGMLDRAGFPPNNFNQFVSTPLNDPLWRERGFLSDDTRVEAPALIVNGWYDYGPGESVAQYRFWRDRGASSQAREHTRLIMTPATHCRDSLAAESESYVVGERAVGDTRFPLRQLYVEWYRHWLDRDGEGQLNWPAVHYYLMGRNEWRVADDMPVPGTQFSRFYLRSAQRGANDLSGDGLLSSRPPQAGERPFSAYAYDPNRPNEIIGGPICCDLTGRDPGSYDQRAAEERDDVLVFTTPPLTEGLEVTGPLRLVLYVESDARDTDFVGKLMDVYPDGRAYLLQEGILRARYREGFNRTVRMRRGEIYRIEIDLQATANYFPPGHSIRLEVASSHFPRFDRNLNTGGEQVTEVVGRIARNRVYHAPGRESFLLLPIAPDDGSRPFSGAPRDPP